MHCTVHEPLVIVRVYLYLLLALYDICTIHFHCYWCSACVYGDPHIVTLDGHKYTFNGKGEFLLIETLDGSFVLQGRMADAPGGTGNTNDAATVFTALVAKQNNSDTVQIELSDAFLMRINGDVYAFDVVNEESFNNVLVSKSENNSYSATFSSGIYIEARVAQTSSGPYISAFIVSLPKRFRNRVKGLMGNYNGDISDDFLPNGGGELLPLNSSLEELHWNFGVTCEYYTISDLECICVCITSP